MCTHTHTHTHTHTEDHPRTQCEDHHLQTREGGGLKGIQTCHHLDVRLLVSRTGRKTQLFKPPSLCVVFCYGSHSKQICSLQCKDIIWLLKPPIVRDRRSQDKGDQCLSCVSIWSLRASVFLLPIPHCLSFFWWFLLCFVLLWRRGFLFDPLFLLPSPKLYSN